MALSPRLFAFAALGIAPILMLQGCGDDASGARTTLGTVQNTSYVVEPPITTTTTTTIATSPEGGQISQTEQIHVVVAGDNLSKIAEAYGTTMDAIVNYNGWTDGINHLLLPGAEVKIPPGLQVPAVTPDAGTDTGTDTGTDAGGDETETQTTDAAGVGCSHTIVANDNPTRVANQYDITVEELSAANAGNPAYQNFLIGSQLTIPANGSC